MNKAIRLATGDYILFLNAGDRLHSPQTLEQMMACIKACRPQTPGVIYGHTDIVDGEGRFIRKRRLAPPEHLNWRSFKSGMLVCHQAFMARTELAKQTPYNLDYRFSADFDWCIRIMKQAQRLSMPLANAHLTVADYLQEGMTTQNHKASLHERFRIMTTHYGWIATLLQHAWFVVRSFTKK